MSINYDLETLEIRIICGNKIIYKDKCSLQNKKGLNEMASILSSKFGINLKGGEEVSWFKID